MRHDETHEGHHPGERHGERREEGGEHDRDELEPLHPHAEMCSVVLPQQHDVELRRKQERYYRMQMAGMYRSSC